MAFDIIIESTAWDAGRLEAVAAQAWDGVAAQFQWPAATYEAALLGCDDARIAELNANFRRKFAPTNVLSWPSEERGAPVPHPAPGELGDIAIAYQTCAREAQEQGKPFESHLCHLLVHALLHLLGFDHESEQEAAEMETIEVEILAKLGIANPY